MLGARQEGDSYRRIEVITRERRRRRWTPEEMARIVGRERVARAIDWPLWFAAFKVNLTLEFGSRPMISRQPCRADPDAGDGRDAARPPAFLANRV
jgi:hypothetical protein